MIGVWFIAYFLFVNKDEEDNVGYVYYCFSIFSQCLKASPIVCVIPGRIYSIDQFCKMENKK